MIVLSNLTFGYDRNRLLWQNLNMSLPSSSVLIGDNGSGKTTWIKLVAKLLQAQKGEITFNDKTHYTSAIFLDSQFLFDDINVQNHLEWLCSDQNYNQIIYQTIVDKFDLSPILCKKVSELSSGEKQWFAICMILSINADIYLLDEPFRFLDKSHRTSLCNYLTDVISNKYIIITSHDRIEGLQMDTVWL